MFLHLQEKYTSQYKFKKKIQWRIFSFVWVDSNGIAFTWICFLPEKYTPLYKSAKYELYEYVWLCMTIYDYVWLCVTMYDYARLCVTMYDFIWLWERERERERERKTILKSFVNFFKVLKLSE